MSNEDISKYIQSIKQFGRINRSREKKLSGIIRRSRNVKNVDEAKKELIQSNLLLVVDRAIKIKNRFPGLSTPIMDLIADGNIALMRAADGYRGDHKSKAAFGTYAIKSIDQKMIRTIQMDRLIHIPAHYFKYRSDFMRLKEKYKDKLTDEIVIKEMDISVDMLDALKDDDNRIVFSLDNIFANYNEDCRWNDVLEDMNSESPSKKTDDDTMMSHLEEYMSRLSEREQTIIRERHLLHSVSPYDNLAVRFKVTRERIRQIHFMALKKLRTFMIEAWQKNHGETDNHVKGNCRFYNEDYRRMMADKERKRAERDEKVFKHLMGC